MLWICRRVVYPPTGYTPVISCKRTPCTLMSSETESSSKFELMLPHASKLVLKTKKNKTY